MRMLKRSILIFVVVVVLSGWLGVVVDKTIGGPTQGETLGMIVWLVLPLITTIFLRIFTNEGWKDTGFSLKFRKNIRFYIAAFCIFPITMLIVFLIGSTFGWVDVSNFNTKEFLSIFGVMFIINMVKNFFEESVWRGYLTEKLIQLKINGWKLYIIVGIVWASWHIPYYLVFLPIEDIKKFVNVSRIEFVLISFVVMTCWSIMFTELYLATKSIWPCVILHAMEDAIVNPLILNDFIHIAEGKKLLVSPLVGIIPIIIFLIAAYILCKMRSTKEEGVLKCHRKINLPKNN